MLTTLQWQALLLGFGSATVVASLVTLVGWITLARNADLDGPIIVGVLAGLVAAGYVAGRLSMRKVFHGTLAALAFGFGVTIASMAGGSPASPLRQAWFLALAAVLGAAGGFVAARAK